jgi:SAM-dependent methyltransferase
MGLTALHLEILAEEAKARPFSGSVVTCGVLDSNITFASLWQAASDKGISLQRTRPRLSPNPGQYPGGCLHSACVLESLGFDVVRAMDASDFEGAEILLDLNQAETPKELVGVADVILEGGTLEHVFHSPHAMRHLTRMVKPGGRIIHTSPASNFIDHGFYSFSPTFFFDYYAENGFRIERLEVWRYGENADIAFRLPYLQLDGKPVHYSEASRQKKNWQPVRVGNSGSGQTWDVHGVVCVATKLTELETAIIPQQHEYSGNQWESQAPSFHLALSKAMELSRRGNLSGLREHLGWMGRVFDPQKDSWSQALQAEALLLEKKGSQAAACFSEPQKALLPILAHALALRESGREEDLNSFLGSLPRLPGGLDECLRWELSQRLRDEKFFQKLPKNRRPSWAKRLRNWFLRKE